MAWYSVGSISVTNNSTTVTGTGTDFISGAQVGEALYINDDLYEIGAIVSGTQLTLADPYLGSTASGLAYKIIPTQSLVADLSSGVADLISDFADVRDYAGNGKFNDGTVASPAITFTQDQNNGLYRIGSDNWGLVAGGSKQLEIKTTGVKLDDNKKVTFGAGDDLQIYSDGTNSIVKESGAGSLNFEATNINFKDATGTDFTARFITGGDVRLYNDGSQKLATTSTGVDVTGTVTADAVDTTSVSCDGLAVGVTPKTGGGTWQHIQFGGTGNLLARFSDTAPDAMFASNYYVNSSGVDSRIVTGESARMFLNNDQFIFDRASSDSADSAVTWARSMTLESNGDVSFYEDTGTTAKMVWDSSAESLGIGTASPDSTAQLHTATASATARNIVESTSASGYSGARLKNASGYWETQIDGANQGLRWIDDGTERMRIDSAGNVGIGTASPSAKLEVAGVKNTSELMLSSSTNDASWNDGDYYGKLSFYSGDSSAAGAGIKGSVVTASTGGGGGTSYMAFNVASTSANEIERMRIDSTGNVGVGTASPSKKLDIASGDISLDSGRTLFLGSDDNVYLNSTSSTRAMRFYTGGSERARIDSSGNLLVGTTSESDWGNQDGFIARQSGITTASSTNIWAFSANRKGNDGSIVEFRKDGSKVGSIGSFNGLLSYMVLDTRANGAGIIGTTDAIAPVTETGALANGTKSLGNSSIRWKDLYLSGGVYLGGTGAANKLDDYEEGVWDVTNNGDATGVISGQLGQYTKIGSLVQVQFQVQTTTDFSSNSMAGLPFIPKIASGISNRYGVYPVFSGQGGGELIYATITDTNDQILFYKGDTTTTFNPTSVSTVYRVCMTYETNE